MVADKDFAEITPGSLSKTPCSPKVDRGKWQGIRIAGPSKVRFGRDTRDPVYGGCTRITISGTYRFKASYLGLGQGFREKLLLVAVNAKTHRAYAGWVAGESGEFANAVIGPPLTDADLAAMSTTGYFNPNLAKQLKLPAEAADYFVYVTLGQYVSNVLSISVVASR